MGSSRQFPLMKTSRPLPTKGPVSDLDPLGRFVGSGLLGGNIGKTNETQHNFSKKARQIEKGPTLQTGHWNVCLTLLWNSRLFFGSLLVRFNSPGESSGVTISAIKLKSSSSWAASASFSYVFFDSFYCFRKEVCPCSHYNQ